MGTSPKKGGGWVRLPVTWYQYSALYSRSLSSLESHIKLIMEGRVMACVIFIIPLLRYIHRYPSIVFSIKLD